MQRASVGERKSQALRPIPDKSPRPALRVIDGGASSLPMWQELLGLLLYLFAHRKKKTENVTLPEHAAVKELEFYDDVPNTGVRQIEAYRPTFVVGQKSFGEIYRESKTVLRPEKPQRKSKNRDRLDEVIFKRVTSHALGQFVRAYLKARGQLGNFLDQRIEQKLGKGKKISEVEYAERIKMRRVERHAMSELLLNLVRDQGRILQDNQERFEDGIDVVHIGRGPKNSYFVRFDPESGVVLGFYSSQGFNRHKAYRQTRKNSYRENRRRLH